MTSRARLEVLLGDSGIDRRVALGAKLFLTPHDPNRKLANDLGIRQGLPSGTMSSRLRPVPSV